MSLPYLTPHIERIASIILGEPNRALSKGSDLRFGTNGSVSVVIDGSKRGEWFDHETGAGGGPYQLIEIKAGVASAEINDWLKDHGFPYKNGHDQSSSRQFQIVKTYDYCDETGELLFQVCRFAPKDFRQRAPNESGGWTWRTKDIRKVPYRLPELVAASTDQTVYICEGEKDADRLAAAGLIATTNPGGAANPRDDGKPTKPKWPPGFAIYFKGRHVVILPDNDPAGYAHAQAIAGNLAPVAASLRIVRLAADWPDMPPKGDVSDWLDSGGTRVRLEKLAAAAPQFQAPTKPAKTSAPNSPTEDALALIFADKRRNQLRYCHDTGSWFTWNGVMWRRETTALAFDWCRKTCRDHGGGKAAFGKASTAAGVERFARADRAFAVTAEVWNQDDFLLGTPGGTVDIKTGQLRPSRQADYITKSTSVAPASTADCPLWIKFLDEATRGDVELIRFLQQWCGYCLTGDTREEALLFAFGPGGNGKGVFLSTIKNILNDYAVTAPMDMLTASKTDRHPTDLAMLHGARLVCASEIQKGRSWAEDRIMALTGNDEITAHFMRQDNFSFQPKFKLTIIANHKPILKSVNDAARRRFNLAPFTFTPENVDVNLKKKLIVEYPAILRWMLDGALDWQKNGLIRPPVVRSATDAYFASQDTISQWIEDCCETAEAPTSLADTSASLYASWRNYALARNEAPGTQISFSETLQDLGFQPIRQTSGIKGRGYLGIKVKVYAPPSPSDYDE